jgi:hypothetical protein
MDHYRVQAMPFMFFVGESDTNRSKGPVNSDGGNDFYYREVGGMT